MGKAKDGNYISQGFSDRIEISLANISRNPNDEFALMGIQFVLPYFKCELCGHEPCIYAYTVKNLKTNISMKVGSECINHFKGKMNIDLASGLKKRVKSVIRQMRRYMKNSLEEVEYKTLPKEQKRVLVTRLFMKHQAMEAIKGDTKKAMLAKEDVLKIIQENPWVETEATPVEDKKEAKKEKKNLQKKSATASATQKTTAALVAKSN
jgi:hypothetical protein